MNPYRLEEIDPPLDETELFLLDVVGALWMAQAKHQFDDPNSPKPAQFLRGKYGSLAEVKVATKKWRDALMQYHKEFPPKPKPRASLDYLWDRIQKPRPFVPTRREGDDLCFETFGISQRFIDEPQSPCGRWPRWYFVGYPTSSDAFRCVANEASNRKFISTKSFSRCEPPAAQDFEPVSVSGIAVNFKTGDRRPAVIQHYLPGCFGKWRIINHSRSQHEEVLP